MKFLLTTIDNKIKRVEQGRMELTLRCTKNMTAPYQKKIITLLSHWYIPMITGIPFLFLGIYVFAVAAGVLVILGAWLSFSLFMSGATQVLFSIIHRRYLDNWSFYFIGGIMYAFSGLWLLSKPAISLALLPFAVGFHVLFQLLNGVRWASSLKNAGAFNWGNVTIVGILGFIFFLLFFWKSLFAGMVLATWTALGLVIAGVAAIILSIKLERVKRLMKKALDEQKIDAD